MDVILLGAGGQAKDIIKNIDDYNADLPKKLRLNIVGCVDDTLKLGKKRELAGYPILNSMDIFDKKSYGRVKVICAVGDPVNKKIFVEKAKDKKLGFFNIIHPSVSVHRTCRIGLGISIFASSVISAFCELRDHVSINYLCSVSHDCRIYDLVTLAPGAKIGGRVVVEEGALLGINSCMINNVRVGSWSVVGAGTTVIGDVPCCTVVAGNPHKILRKREKNTPFI